MVAGALRANHYLVCCPNVLSILGQLFCGDSDTHVYIVASLQYYPAQREIKDLMESQRYRDCGFGDFCLRSMAINHGTKPQ